MTCPLSIKVLMSDDFTRRFSGGGGRGQVHISYLEGKHATAFCRSDSSRLVNTLGHDDPIRASNKNGGGAGGGWGRGSRTDGRTAASVLT